MTIDLTGFYADTDFLLTEWGETVDVYRLTVNYNTIPPTETWADAADVTMEIQPIAGSKLRHDAGILAEATHWGFADYDSGVLVTDRIYRAGETNNYNVLREDNLEDHLEIWMKYVAGAV